VKSAVDKKGYLIGLDGRRLAIRSEHAALNTLLQLAGALICKKWVQLVDEELRKSGLDAAVVGWIHDELQAKVKRGFENDVCDIARRSAKAAGEYFQFGVPIEADATVGTDWSVTH
jgi:DNA polymerase I-like protein with 3'-5' exonuclease and polymerase domains